MVDELVLQTIVEASSPDSDVPNKRVETVSDRNRRKRRAERFLKGPIPFSWIRENIQCAADRLLLVLKAHADMRGSDHIKVTADILRDAGIPNRKTAYRSITKLEVGGSLSTLRKRGSRPIICLKEKLT